MPKACYGTPYYRPNCLATLCIVKTKTNGPSPTAPPDELYVSEVAYPVRRKYELFDTAEEIFFISAVEFYPQRLDRVLTFPSLLEPISERNRKITLAPPSTRVLPTEWLKV